jgi:rare lipoprotein A
LRRGDVMGWQSAALMGGRIARAGALVLGALVLAHCSAGNKYSAKVVEDGEPVPKGGGNYKVGKPYTINGRTYFPSENMSYRAEGIASWYGPDFHGRLTANGEVYDMHGISAAHTTMPLPSYARVTNLANGRSIVVRVNDRGPYARNRIIDLSVGTAKALKFYGQGLASVQVEYLGRAPLDGSDDRMLMATLREGSPAPAPSNVMVASAKPFLPGFGGAATHDDAPLPPERPFLLGAGSNRSAGQARNAEVTSTNKPPARSLVRSPAATAAEADDTPSAPPTAGPAVGFAPMRSQGAVGLMSGRGLY